MPSQTEAEQLIDLMRASVEERRATRLGSGAATV
jgi:hypothetical protein